MQVYPCNAELWGMLMQAEAAACSFARLRRTLTAALAGNPSSLALVLALALCESVTGAPAASSVPRIEVSSCCCGFQVCV